MTSNQIGTTFPTINLSLTTLEDRRLPLGEDLTTNATRAILFSTILPLMWLESREWADTVSHAVSLYHKRHMQSQVLKLTYFTQHAA